MAYLTGTTNDDGMGGTAANDTLMGGGGADTIDGLGGADVLYGGTENDVIYGGAGADSLNGGDGADSLLGGDDNDTIIGGGGNDTVDGGAGNDYISESTSLAVLQGDLANGFFSNTGSWSLVAATGAAPVISGGFLRFNTSNKATYGDYAQQTVQTTPGATYTVTVNAAESGGGVGNHDILVEVLDQNGNVIGTSGVVTILDGAAAQNIPVTYVATTPGATIRITNTGSTSTTTTDLVVDSAVNTLVSPPPDPGAAGGDDSLSGGAGNDTILSGQGNDSLYGGTGNDDLRGEQGNDSLDGGDGNDTLRGEQGNDSLDGGLGNDSMNGGAGNDTGYGGAGNDYISDSDEPGTVYNPSFTISNGAGWTEINPTGGTNQNSSGVSFTWAPGSALLNSGDAINNGDGIAQQVSTTIGAQYQITVNAREFGGGSASHDLLVEAVDDNGIVLNSVLVTVTNGSSANPTLDYTATTAGTTIRVTNPSSTGSNQTDLYIDSVTNVLTASTPSTDSDLYYGGMGNDTIYSDDPDFPNSGGNDSLYGGGDNDQVYGGAGNDLVHGDQGNDALYGGIGNDAIEGGGGNDTAYGGDGDDTITDIENVGGEAVGTLTNPSFNSGLSGWTPLNPTSGNGPTTGNYNGDNYIALNSANEAIYGDGIEQSVITTAGSTYTVSVYCGELGGGSASHTVLIEVLDASNNVIATRTEVLGDAQQQTFDLNYVATGSATTIRITNPTSTGTSSSDLAIWSVNNTLVPITYDDTFHGDAGNDVLDGAAGNDSLFGGADNDTLYGGEGRDSLSGGDGNDQIFGGSGNDTVDGGAGNDLIVENDPTVPNSLGPLVNGEIDSADGWEAVALTGAPPVFNTNSNGGGGTNAGVFTFNGANKATYGDYIQQTIAVTAGVSYTAQTYVREVGSGNSDQIYRLDILDENGNVIATTGNLTVFNAVQGVSTPLVYTPTGSAVTIRVTNVGVSSTTVNSDMEVWWVRNSLTNASDSPDAIGYNDNLSGGLGDDTISAGYGNDTLSGGDGNDSLVGGADNDSLDGGVGNDTVWGDDTAGTFAGNDSIQGGSGDDLIYGGQGTDTIYGDNANDTITGGADTIYGGDGNESVFGGANNDLLYGDAGNDSLYGGNADDTLYGGSGDDLLDGGLGYERLYGGAGNDTLIGGGGIFGDTLDGGEGNDVLTGGAGADVFIADGTADRITDFDISTGIGNGNQTDNDFVDLSGFYNPTTLAAWNIANPGQQFATPLQWLRYEQATGTLTSAGGLQIQNGGVAVSAAGLLTENTAVTSLDGYVDGSQNADIIDSGYIGDPDGDKVDNNDAVLPGHSGNDDYIRAYGGNDLVYAGDGNDIVESGYGNDTVYGGVGNDRIVDTESKGAEAAGTLLNSGFNTDLSGWTVLNPTGGSLPVWDTASGDGFVRINRNDESSYGDGIRQNVTTTIGSEYKLSVLAGETGGAAGNHTVLLEVLDANSNVIATKSVVILDGTTQTVDLSYVATTSSTSIRITNPTSTATVTTDLAIYSATNTLVPATYDDVLHGDAGDDEIFGGAGNDTIDGGADNDTLKGGAGNDSIDGGTGNDSIEGGDNNDTIHGGGGDDTIVGDGPTYTVPGTGGSTTGELISNGTFNSGSQAGWTEGPFTAGIGTATVAPAHGGLGFGNDPYFQDVFAYTSVAPPAGSTALNIQFDYQEWHGAQQLSSPNTYLTFYVCTNPNDYINSAVYGPVTLQGTSLQTEHYNLTVPISGTGPYYLYYKAHTTDQYNPVIDNVSVTATVGGTPPVDITPTGDDLIFGEAGNDSIHGNGGNDTIYGGADNDTVYGDDGNDSIGGDAGDDSLYGGAGNDEIAGGADADHLFGGTGNDTLTGGQGADTMEGGDNDDLLIGDGGDGVIGQADEIYGGTGNDTIHGNGGHDSLFGDQGDDEIYGESGNDLIDGGAGVDSLFGGLGNDTFSGAFDAGDSIVGGEDPGNTDWDVLDLTALGTVGVDYEVHYGGGNNEAGTVEFLTGSYTGQTFSFAEIEQVIACFTRGTMIVTDAGEVAIEDLRQGDLVLTRDNGFQPVRWIGKAQIGTPTLALKPNLRPIRIRAGALGHGLPTADLVVSPQHRVLIVSTLAERMFGEREVLMAAKHLTAIDGIEVAEDMAAVEYWHFLLDDHQIVISNGAATESLFTGPEALKAVPEASRREILEIFPELAELNHAALPEPARLLVPGRPARRFAMRAARNNKSLVI
jgi:Ca2+-binding RTX toxin-like protein